VAGPTNLYFVDCALEMAASQASSKKGEGWRWVYNWIVCLYTYGITTCARCLLVCFDFLLCSCSLCLSMWLIYLLSLCLIFKPQYTCMTTSSIDYACLARLSHLFVSVYLPLRVICLCGFHLYGIEIFWDVRRKTSGEEDSSTGS